MLNKKISYLVNLYRFYFFQRELGMQFNAKQFEK